MLTQLPWVLGLQCKSANLYTRKCSLCCPALECLGMVFLFWKLHGFEYWYMLKCMLMFFFLIFNIWLFIDSDAESQFSMNDHTFCSFMYMHINLCTHMHMHVHILCILTCTCICSYMHAHAHVTSHTCIYNFDDKPF